MALETEVEESPRTWFPEPDISDDTWGRRGESTFLWLSRSTVPRAAAARLFLNRNIALLPPVAQPKMYKALRTRWPSAYFELIVARTLQVLGATLAVEPVSSNGSRVDFVAQFSDGVVNVEAISPVIEAQAGETIKTRNPLLDLIESRVPDGWSVEVWELPDIGPNDSKQEFRTALDELVSALTPEHAEPVESWTMLPQGLLRLVFSPNPASDRAVRVEPPITSWNNTKKHIKRAVVEKKRQARAASGASLVAIHAGGISSSFEDFDMALFGHTTAFVDRQFGVLSEGFEPDGVFTTTRFEPSTFAGALAFIEVGLTQCPAPVLYMHPRFDGMLPAPLLTLERRQLKPDRSGILSHSAEASDLLIELGFVADS